MTRLSSCMQNALTLEPLLQDNAECMLDWLTQVKIPNAQTASERRGGRGFGDEVRRSDVGTNYIGENVRNAEARGSY